MTTTPISIKQAHENARQKHIDAVQNLSTKRVFIDIDPVTFRDILILKSEIIFNERSEPKQYAFDYHNKSLIQQMYYYVTGNSKFSGSLHKGIHLWGSYGCGKTTLLQAICEMISEISGRKIEMVYAKEFEAKLLQNGKAYYSKRPLFFDDLGREPQVIKDYGNTIYPVPDVYYMRKETGAWTFQTCQFPIKELKEKYGEFATDRMRAAFNEIEFKGTSRR